MNPLEDRIAVLASLEFVDYVIPFGEDTPEKLIREIAPDILVKGGDYQISEIVGADGVKQAPFKRYTDASLFTPTAKRSPRAAAFFK